MIRVQHNQLKDLAGELEVDIVIVSGSTIGVSGDTDLLSMSSGVLTVNGNVNATKLVKVALK